VFHRKRTSRDVRAPLPPMRGRGLGDGGERKNRPRNRDDVRAQAIAGGGGWASGAAGGRVNWEGVGSQRANGVSRRENAWEELRCGVFTRENGDRELSPGVVTANDGGKARGCGVSTEENGGGVLVPRVSTTKNGAPKRGCGVFRWQDPWDRRAPRVFPFHGGARRSSPAISTSENGDPSSPPAAPTKKPTRGGPAFSNLDGVRRSARVLGLGSFRGAFALRSLRRASVLGEERLDQGAMPGEGGAQRTIGLVDALP